MRPLWQYSAKELVAGFADRAFTPEDALVGVLERCAEANPELNAVVTLDEAAAFAAARISTERWKAGESLSPLDGVPITVKDNLLVKGLRSTWGSLAFADHVPDHDELPVQRLRAAGLVISAKTNVPELTVQGYTDNRLFGATGNPAGPGLTPGGSSGGAAAAVAVGIAPLALATDGGGSIRRPAAHTGVFGLKPSSRTVARGLGFPAILGEFEVVGPLARTLDDIALVLAVLASRRLAEPELPASPRILYARTFAGQPVDPQIAAGIDAAARTFAANGCTVDMIESLDWLAPMDAIWPVISTAGVAWLFDREPRLAELASPAIRAMADAGRALTASDYAGAMVAIEALKCGFDRAMQGYDALLTPTIAALSWPKAETHPPVIAGQAVGPRGHAIFTAFANALGLPGLSIPAGRSREGLPFGLQLVGRFGAENTLLALARAVRPPPGPTAGI